MNIGDDPSQNINYDEVSGSDSDEVEEWSRNSPNFPPPPPPPPPVNSTSLDSSSSSNSLPFSSTILQSANSIGTSPVYNFPPPSYLLTSTTVKRQTSR